MASFSEARKFAAHFSLANQFTQQIPEKVRAAVLGNAGSLIVFCVASADATWLAPEFDELPPSELTEQHPFTAWIAEAIWGTRRSRRFRASLHRAGAAQLSSNKAAETSAERDVPSRGKGSDEVV